MKIFEIITENNDSNMILGKRYHLGYAWTETRAELNVLCSEKLKLYLDDAFDAIEIDVIRIAKRRIDFSIKVCNEFIEFINDTNREGHSSQFDSYINTELRQGILEYKKFEQDAATFVSNIKEILEQTALDIENGNSQPALEKIKFVRKQCREKSRELSSR